MATLLLIVIYISFVGLGVPDSLFGTAWPAIYAQWGLPVSFATFVNSINSVFSFLSSLVSAR
ncbi:MAG: MFS transporter, partial [Clostridia bacterium]|nr:MFS transporter [Clostridia bacterium]